MHSPETKRATLIGCIAVLMWSTLPVLATFTKPIPPFQVVSLAFLVAFAVMALSRVIRGKTITDIFTAPLKIWAFGAYGFALFHMFYFPAFRHAPAADLLLIINLFPLLMVLFAALLEKKPLHWYHGIGVMMGFVGIAVVALKDGFHLSPHYIKGYSFAALCAVIWSSFSVLNRRVNENAPEGMMAGYCLLAGIFLSAMHYTTEPTVGVSAAQLMAILFLGMGPMGLAFTAWNHGTRHGDVKTLGSVSYLSPVLGLVYLIALGYTQFRWEIIIALGLVVGGAAIGSLGIMQRRKVPLP